MMVCRLFWLSAPGEAHRPTRTLTRILLLAIGQFLPDLS